MSGVLKCRTVYIRGLYAPPSWYSIRTRFPNEKLLHLCYTTFVIGVDEDECTNWQAFVQFSNEVLMSELYKEFKDGVADNTASVIAVSHDFMASNLYRSHIHRWAHLNTDMFKQGV
jgi:hypothetical protein